MKGLGMNVHKTQAPEESWQSNLPASRMIFPKSLWNRTKYIFWRLYTPYHPMVRDKAQKLGITPTSFAKHERSDRQNYLLGTVAEHLSIEEFVLALIEQGYGKHFVAWKDQGEVASLRYVEDFVWQYHVRVFDDREVRAHYEYTPECRPVSHLKGRNQQERRAEFLEMLGDTIQLTKEGE